MTQKLEEARKLYQTANADQRYVLESLFPELKENEDERIKKVLIDYFNRYKEQEECGIKTFYGIPTDNILAWLEKQGEQKPTTKLEYDENGEPILTSFESELFSVISEVWQGYLLGEEVNIAKIVKEHSAELLERANEQNPVVYDKDAEKASEEYRNFRMSCGIKDPVMLNEIEEAYYEGAIRK